ncbi:MAG: FtsX-like permease family protein [Eubacterium sp.]|nr:FtsX-like permease family protein [Eubacterium sp.]
MNKGMIKTTIREMKGSLGRYLAILAIVMLGVALFTGLKATTPAMIATENDYLAEKNFYDYRLLSTIGFEASDVEQIAEMEQTANAEGAVSVDAVCSFGDGNESVYKFHTVPDTINQISLTAGRMPENPNECLLDSALYDASQLGSQLTVTDNNTEETLDMFEERTFTAVGIVRSPYYINFERGTTSIGEGKITAFLYVPSKAFACDYLTEIYVKTKQKFDVYTDAYEDYIDALQDEMEGKTESLVLERFRGIQRDAQAEIDDAQAELDQEMADAQKELADARKKIAEGEQEIIDGEQDLRDGKRKAKEGEQEIAANEQKLADSEQELSEGEQEIRKNEQEIQDAQAKLLQAEREIVSNEKKLADGKAELQQAKAELNTQETKLRTQETELLKQETKLNAQETELLKKESELKTQEASLAKQEAELAKQETELSSQETELAKQESELVRQETELAEKEAQLTSQEESLQKQMASLDNEEKKQVQDALAQVQSALAQLQPGLAELQQGLVQVRDGLAELRAGLTQVRDGLAQVRDGLTQVRDGLVQVRNGLTQVRDGQKQLQAGKKEIQSGKVQLQAAKQEIADNEKTLTASEKELTAGKLQTEAARKELQDGKAALAQGKAKLQNGRAELADGKKKLEQAKAELKDAQSELKKGRQDLEKGKAELADARTEYKTAKADFDKETADAQRKIDDARTELAELKQPDYYVLTRNTNIGYACYESDSNIVAGIANVFPVFFFLVAALICMTTMNRMVEEQRTQIGVLKALGYGNGAIMWKYLFYAGSAAAAGAVLGCIIGTWLFPKVIWMGYSIMYSMGEITYYFDGWMAFLSLLAALLCSMGAAYASCRYELYSVPASLIRPKAPKSGKRIFLENITFIWSRMKFLHKVSVRNIFRYKKRFFMMVLGISGCTALLVTGFGIKDSVTNVADMQYDEIQIYDIGITFSETISKTQLGSLMQGTGETLAQAACHYEESADLEFGGKTKSVYLEIPEDTAQTSHFLKLHTKDGAAIPYPAKDEAVLSAKVAETLGIRVGDTVTLRDMDMNSISVKVSALCENYVYNYAYICNETYEAQLGTVPEYKSAYVTVKEGADIHEAAAVIADRDDVLSVSVTQDMRDRIASMMKSMDYIVLLIIVCAGSLAFIVLYNLTNINITERLREIATIKVLGFYARETADYVFRENLALTGLGALAGLALGKWLHWFVMDQVKIDMLSFKTLITPGSYVLSLLFTFGFAMLVNGLMYFKLENIHMAEALKSIE